MTSAHARAAASPGSSPGYALGVFRDRGAAPGAEFAGLVRNGWVRDLSGFGTVNDLLRYWDDAQRRLEELAAAPDTGDWTDLTELDVRCPVSPGQILQAGANYRKHVVDIVMAERRADRSQTGHNSDVPEAEVRRWAENMMDERARTGAPYVFAGLPSALTGPYDEIVLPERGDKHDWELELAVVIGKPARNLTRENALDHVAGYTISNDITTRSLVYRHDLKAIGSDWFAAKNSPTFLPTGPYLVPAKFAGDPARLRVTLRHNGIIRQDESTADMLFDLPAILVYITQVTELRPGDLVLTGSPAGNGMHWGVFLADGDLVEGEITGLGTQRNRCARRPGASRHSAGGHGASGHGAGGHGARKPTMAAAPSPGQPATRQESDR
jgi:2-keto-4-pentenoate hydratase/2-oxohepta-3-ene-1,7-dioic acid hydratase in catechol pathway